MARPATGELRPLVVGFEARIRIDDEGARKGYRLSGLLPTDEVGAQERCTAMARMAQRLRRAGLVAEIDQTMTMAAKARPGKHWAAVVAAVDMLCSGTTEAADRPKVPTFGELLDDWADGKLATRFRHHVKEKKSGESDRKRARKHIPADLLDLPVDEWTLSHADIAMTNIPAQRSDGTRRHVAQIIRKVLDLAVYPCRHRQACPIPKNWVPKVTSKKAKECLYPDEDAKLLACREIPIVRRLAYGFLSREGMRADELSRLQWRDVDLERGRVDLDVNKTDDPRAWALDDGCLAALRIWKDDFNAEAEESERVFVERGIPLKIDRLAEQLREDLRLAGVTRSKLFESNGSRIAIRAHDLRATFVTVALANGKTETWIADRTGHKSSAMIQRYRRKASMWTEMKLRELVPLWRALPEFTPRNAPYFVGQPGLEPETNGLRGPDGAPPRTARRDSRGDRDATCSPTTRDGANAGQSAGQSEDDLRTLVAMLAELRAENARLRGEGVESEGKKAPRGIVVPLESARRRRG